MRFAAVIVWALVAVVDVAGDQDTNPPPDPPREGRELWEI